MREEDDWGWWGGERERESEREKGKRRGLRGEKRWGSVVYDSDTCIIIVLFLAHVLIWSNCHGMHYWTSMVVRLGEATAGISGRRIPFFACLLIYYTSTCTYVRTHA